MGTPLWPMKLYTCPTTNAPSSQMREHGEDVNDKAKCHGGLQNIVVDEQEIPLKFKRGLVPVVVAPQPMIPMGHEFHGNVSYGT